MYGRDEYIDSRAGEVVTEVMKLVESVEPEVAPVFSAKLAQALGQRPLPGGATIPSALRYQNAVGLSSPKGLGAYGNSMDQLFGGFFRGY